MIPLLLLTACGSPDPLDSADPVDTSEPDSPPTFAAEALWSESDDWEPTVAADLGGPWVYQSTTRIGADIAETVVRVSGDHGDSWGADMVLSDEYTAFDPQLAVAADTGCVYFAWLGGPGGWGTYVRRSCDHGETWSDPVAIAPVDWTTDHAWMVVSPDGDDVYLAFNGAEGGEDAEAGKGYVAVSHDAGASFEDVFVVGDAETEYWFETGAALAPDGTLYVSNAVFSKDYHGTADLVLWRSTDGGASFDIATLASSEEPPSCGWATGCDFGYFAAQAAVAVDPSGGLLFVWTANEAAGDDLATWAARSPGGEAWDQLSEPVLLSEGLALNGMPAAVGGPAAGDLRVAWQGNNPGDDRETFNTWYQESHDGGLTWLDEAIRVSSEPDSADYKSAEGYAFPYGDYFGMSVDGDGRAHLIWSEGASWRGPGGTWFAAEDPSG